MWCAEKCAAPKSVLRRKVCCAEKCAAPKSVVSRKLWCAEKTVHNVHRPRRPTEQLRRLPGLPPGGPQALKSLCLQCFWLLSGPPKRSPQHVHLDARCCLFGAPQALWAPSSYGPQPSGLCAPGPGAPAPRASGPGSWALGPRAQEEAPAPGPGASARRPGAPGPWPLSGPCCKAQGAGPLALHPLGSGPGPYNMHVVAHWRDMNTSVFPFSVPLVGTCISFSARTGHFAFASKPRTPRCLDPTSQRHRPQAQSQIVYILQVMLIHILRVIFMHTSDVLIHMHMSHHGKRTLNSLGLNEDSRFNWGPRARAGYRFRIWAFNY